MKKEYKQVYNAIKKYDNIIILRHEAPDFDASGSQFGLACFIKDNFPKKNVLCLGKPHKIFSTKLYPKTDIDAVIPDKYLCIVVDVANAPRIDGKEYLEKADFIIKIDHHPLCDEYGDIAIIDDSAAAASEIIAEMLIAFKKKISKQCSYYLYSGIVGDSGRFMYSDTSKRTFKVASELFKTGFNFLDVYDKMYLKSIDDLKVINFIMNNYKITDKGIAYVIFSADDLDNLHMPREQAKAHVNFFSGYEEIKIWVQFSEDTSIEDENKWRASIRSRGVKINDVASNFNGGGHDFASGARVKDKDGMLALLNELEKLL